MQNRFLAPQTDGQVFSTFQEEQKHPVISNPPIFR